MFKIGVRSDVYEPNSLNFSMAPDMTKFYVFILV